MKGRAVCMGKESLHRCSKYSDTMELPNFCAVWQCGAVLLVKVWQACLQAGFPTSKTSPELCGIEIHR